MATAIVILLVLVALYFNIAPNRVIPPKGASPEQIELMQIKRKIAVFERVTHNEDTATGLFWHLAISVGALFLPFIFVGALIALFTDDLSLGARLMLPGMFVAMVAIPCLMYHGRRKLALLRNRAEMLEEFLSVKHSGKHDETELNALKTVLEHQLKRRDEATLEEMSNWHYGRF